MNMCITEEKLVDRYGQGNPHERFMLIYKNYEVLLNLVKEIHVVMRTNGC